MTGGPPPSNFPPPMPQPGYGQPYYAPKEAQYATASMVLGIVALVVLPVGCCCGFGELISLGLGVAALALGISARGKINAGQGTLGGSGKALAGIITGATAIVIAVVVFVALLVFGVAYHGLINSIPTPSG